ncbi:uncharacterized protein NDAI_0E04060 [Naumovozyma dairenensis CBS 421]|uniref:C2 NT-type domain-containing protein n=1 Tax=Naumovozyma dairenensis (strain ATCC 10597 / BCRC 20456 / CBS 421 / NBRC 0211 / NRRL Y-12639) TaxID=1071378 RepID=G0WBV3_NAUDC|nr:hypothetical protein NDAI_0E04060 [Naumovozyma dairenensis CBS 421]CCD25223.1 hypothetical protein NDAI_0E04060 [Naumovozyma dairenensis CBS 421]
MAAFSNKNKERRPKFLLFLKINELVNIPQSSGYCYVKWHLKDGTGISPHPKISSTTNDSINISKRDSNATIPNGVSSSSSGSANKTTNDIDKIAMNQSHGTTPKVLVKHHKVQWNFALSKPLQIKLQVDKSRNLQNKYMKFDVFFEFLDSNSSSYCTSPIKCRTSTDTNKGTGDDEEDMKKIKRKTSISSMKSTGSNSYSQKISGKILLGSITIDITEYVKPNEMAFTNRFLLQDSKINSIINVSLQLKIFRGSYNDFNCNKFFTNGQLSNNAQNYTSQGDTLQSDRGGGGGSGGITDILETNSNQSSSNIGNTNTESSTSFNMSNGRFTNNTNNSSRSTGAYTSSATTTSSSFDNNKYIKSTISNSMKPLIEKLYEKTFQLSWDPRPNEFTPKECINDILNGGNGWAKNEKGINLIDLQTLQLNEMELEDPSSLNHGAGAGGHEEEGSNYFSKMSKKEFLERKRRQLERQNSKNKSNAMINNHSNSNNGSNWTHLSPSQREKLRGNDNSNNNQADSNVTKHRSMLLNKNRNGSYEDVERDDDNEDSVSSNEIRFDENDIVRDVKNWSVNQIRS